MKLKNKWRRKTVTAEEIGQRLVKLRDIRPRTGVAKALGISYSALCNYEKGLRIPPDPVKLRMAAYYHTTVNDLFFD